MPENKLSIVAPGGKVTEVPVDVALYREAAEGNVSFAQLVNQKFEADPAHGTAFQQLLMGSGLALKRDDVTGLPATKMSDILHGDANLAIVRPDGSQALTVAGRLLFPAVIAEMVEHALREDTSRYEAVFNQMVMLNTSVNSPRIDQPVINVTAPRGSVAGPVAQMSEPDKMVSISLSDKTYKVPTYSIGFEISDDAAKAVAIDLVGITLRQQMEGQRAANVDNALSSLLNGDTDKGLTSLSGENASTYDSAITSGTMTHKGWLKWLFKDWKKLTIDWVICDLDTYLAIEGRSGRPSFQTDKGQDERLNVGLQVANPGLPSTVNFFIVDTAVIGANTLVGIDSSKAIQKFTYVGAAYSAIEQYVMRRSSAMRFDFAELYTRFYSNNDGWKKLVLA